MMDACADLITSDELDQLFKAVELGEPDVNLLNESQVLLFAAVWSSTD